MGLVSPCPLHGAAGSCRRAWIRSDYDAGCGGLDDMP